MEARRAASALARRSVARSQKGSSSSSPREGSDSAGSATRARARVSSPSSRGRNTAVSSSRKRGGGVVVSPPETSADDRAGAFVAGDGARSTRARGGGDPGRRSGGAVGAGEGARDESSERETTSHSSDASLWSPDASSSSWLFFRASTSGASAPPAPGMAGDRGGPRAAGRGGEAVARGGEGGAARGASEGRSRGPGGFLKGGGFSRNSRREPRIGGDPDDESQCMLE